MSANSWNFPDPVPAKLPKPFYFVGVDGFPRRPEVYETQAAAEKAAKSISQYHVATRVTIYRAEPLVAMRDEAP
jgi:hypothetical protein